MWQGGDGGSGGDNYGGSGRGCGRVVEAVVVVTGRKASKYSY